MRSTNLNAAHTLTRKTNTFLHSYTKLLGTLRILLTLFNIILYNLKSKIMNLDTLNVSELNAHELVEITGGQGKPVLNLDRDAMKYIYYNYVMKPITDEDVCREFGDCK